jgi:hypothetical protein
LQHAFHLLESIFWAATFPLIAVYPENRGDKHFFVVMGMSRMIGDEIAPMVAVTIRLVVEWGYPVNLISVISLWFPVSIQ